MKTMKKSTYALIILLAISILGNLFLFSAWLGAKYPEPIPVAGTYRTITNDMYIILDKAGTYCLYQPGGPVEQGTYESLDYDRYALWKDGTDESFRTVLIRDGRLYLSGNQNDVIELTWYSDIAYYDNVPEVLNALKP